MTALCTNLCSFECLTLLCILLSVLKKFFTESSDSEDDVATVRKISIAKQASESEDLDSEETQEIVHQSMPSLVYDVLYTYQV